MPRFRRSSDAVITCGGNHENDVAACAESESVVEDALGKAKKNTKRF